ncbi:hypothetical protein DEO72_LG3g1233 [Vigna unguiculata]|uniref:Uncharacterized protein n=1 Tax=Vigna unguiculata TaxID=3917 RepID=A0A4D6LDW8_VIGUN|nr:hypothetical protein DEO72_LG3g1233 [Vigna unguiculata]
MDNSMIAWLSLSVAMRNLPRPPSGTCPVARRHAPYRPTVSGFVTWWNTLCPKATRCRNVPGAP